VVNTHWHFDHADGNDWLGREGAKIIAHEMTLKHLSTAQRVEDWNFDFPPSSIPALPSVVVADTHELDINGDRVSLRFYGNAHTDGDLSVFFQNSNVLHTGDTFRNGIYPFIDRSTGGSIDGMIEAARWNVDICDADTLVVSGHAKPVGNRYEPKVYMEMLVAIRAPISASKSKGMSLGEVQAQRPTSAFDAVWGRFEVTPDFFTKLVYESS
jgi:glyoxylase-like metal-dependent hydrolase (beta-lactamase superfamily II)